tara:strand:+ start:267 stop:590 length:324 start_codon:yes stop_codon:yes gene_type:complete
MERRARERAGEYNVGQSARAQLPHFRMHRTTVLGVGIALGAFGPCQIALWVINEFASAMRAAKGVEPALKLDLVEGCLLDRHAAHGVGQFCAVGLGAQTDWVAVMGM